MQTTKPRPDIKDIIVAETYNLAFRKGRRLRAARQLVEDLRPGAMEMLTRHEGDFTEVQECTPVLVQGAFRSEQFCDFLRAVQFVEILDADPTFVDGLELVEELEAESRARSAQEEAERKAAEERANLLKKQIASADTEELARARQELEEIHAKHGIA